MLSPASCKGEGEALVEAVIITPDETAAATRRRQRLGVLLVVLVALLYVFSGVFIQLLFDDLEYDKPFAFSYISVMLCSCYLLNAGYRQCQQGALRSLTGHAYSNLPSNSNLPTADAAVSVLQKPKGLVKPAIMLAPAYFALNYCYFLALDMTSVSETMILSASTGLWTLIFSRLILLEKLTVHKLVSVAVAASGVCMITLSSRAAMLAHNGSHASATKDGMISVAGDALALLSAAASGIYCVLLRLFVPDEEQVHMPSLFGSVGFTCSICFLPLFPLLHFSGVETFELPPSRAALGALLVNAILSTVLPDMLLAQAVVMTSPLLATLGLSLMIPLSVVADYIRGYTHLTPGFFAGATAVFIAFQLENWAEMKQKSVESIDSPHQVCLSRQHAHEALHGVMHGHDIGRQSTRFSRDCEL
mmetsp:Transcript_65402/g.108698  ORF Transcript_65402/g.108698 Transcript_65402/m.108698 type:complete len:419 (+) Transcript_65402:49-1305(+)|eukprot:CAMPEP_0119321544 /NCGR_PEP_ID=MMETSP1333-20130426/55684_1 /TAXON_ID=418940 /ORGANISM="Scyphosphaera apsteinii, Strain RCC1455" /LENGTH=418 /DNA_ID=CAMNT_0007328543 /DNA_START=48 /DNA_END=1304 /DNA_ORIENTATION=+